MIRQADVADTELVCQLVAEFYDVDGHDYVDATVRAALAPLLAGQDPRPGVVWLILDADDVVGYAVVTWGHAIESGGREALLDELYVRNRRQGTGGRALDEIIAAARRAGAKRMFLESERPNEEVRRFYGRHGFKVDDSIWMSRDL